MPKFSVTFKFRLVHPHLDQLFFCLPTTFCGEQSLSGIYKKHLPERHSMIVSFRFFIVPNTILKGEIIFVLFFIHLELRSRTSGLLTSTTGRICLSMLYRKLLLAFRKAWRILVISRSFTVVGRIQHKQCFTESDFLCCFAAVTPDNFLLDCAQT